MEQYLGIDDVKEKRIETIAELENALEEIESGEGLSTFVEGHGLNSHRFRFEWSEPLLHISYDLPTGRALSPEEDQKTDDAETGAAIRLAIVLLRAFAQGKPESFEDGSEWVFKPELAGRLTAPNSPLNIGMNVNQEMTRINLAVQTTANALELDDIMVKTSVGTHNGQFGMFMEKAPGVTGKEFKKSGKSELTQMNDADFGKVVGGMMRKLNRLQWFDIITGQGDRHADNYMINVNKGFPPSVDIKAIDNDASYGVFRQGLHKFVLLDDARTGGMVGIFQDTLNNLAHCITIPKQNNASNDPQAAQKKKESVQDARKNFKQAVMNDPGITKDKDGSITIDLTKARNPQLLKALLKNCAIKNVAPPEEIDQQLYDKLMTLAKGGAKRNEYLSSLAQRLGENSEQYKAAVQRLDESIDHARNLAKDGKVYKETDWENHDTQRKIAMPNLANKERKLDTYGANISEKTLEAMTNNGRYVSYSNSFFRDFYDTLIKGSPHEDWFAPENTP